ncbi:MAG: hypothetical protein JXA00_01640 [Candidatus Thermoplasmatota archaeon]|nr:hypothetical protein [Candidatus Thermoplasmatota archaeon]
MRVVYKTLLERMKKRGERGWDAIGRDTVAEMPAVLAGISSISESQVILERMSSLIYLRTG